MTAIAAICVFFITVLVHEFGHFIAAKKSGILVHEFSIGLGPRLFGKKIGETLYSLRLLPIGGACFMEGENETSDNSRSLTNQKPLTRILVLVAGPFMNFILALVLLFIVNMTVGSVTTTIDKVLPDSPALEAGLMKGDEILSVNTIEVNSWQQFANFITAVDSNDIKPLSIEIMRNDSIKTFEIVPKYFVEESRIMIGIQPSRKHNIFMAMKEALNYLIFMISLMFGFLKSLFTGQLSSNDIGGPVAVVSQIGEAAKYGFLTLLNFTAFINVNLGFFNLLPIPALDGSRIIFAITEIVRRKPIPPEKEGFIHFIGFAFLMLLMLFITYKDILKLFQ